MTIVVDWNSGHLGIAPPPVIKIQAVGTICGHASEGNINMIAIGFQLMHRNNN